MHPFEVLAEPARRRIIDVLASGEHTAGELAAVVGGELRIGRTAVSKHLRVLRDTGFVDVRAELQWRWYWLTELGFEMLEREVDGVREKWVRRVGWDAERLREHDTLAAPVPYAPVPFRGPGRGYRRGLRGRQTEPPPVPSEPDLGLFRVLPVPDPPRLEPWQQPPP